MTAIHLKPARSGRRDEAPTPWLSSPSWSAISDLRALLSSGGPTFLAPPTMVSKMRRLLTAIGSELEILDLLGEAAVRCYFYQLEGPAMCRPYFFPAEMEGSLLGAYLHFELHHADQRYQRECVIEFMRTPLLEGRTATEQALDFDFGCNLTLSHLRSDPLSFARLMVTLSPREMCWFLKGIDGAATKRVRSVFGHLFDHERIGLVDRYARTALKEDHLTAAALRSELDLQDSAFFDALPAGGLGRRRAPTERGDSVV